MAIDDLMEGCIDCPWCGDEVIVRECSRCGTLKPWQDFYGEHSWVCKECKKEYQRANAPQGDRRCSNCQEYKKDFEFPGKDRYCRMCRSAYTRGLAHLYKANKATGG